MGTRRRDPRRTLTRGDRQPRNPTPAPSRGRNEAKGRESMQPSHAGRSLPSTQLDNSSLEMHRVGSGSVTMDGDSGIHGRY